jgi:hypothetical protein
VRRGNRLQLTDVIVRDGEILGLDAGVVVLTEENEGIGRTRNFAFLLHGSLLLFDEEVGGTSVSVQRHVSVHHPSQADGDSLSNHDGDVVRHLGRQLGRWSSRLELGLELSPNRFVDFVDDGAAALHELHVQEGHGDAENETRAKAFEGLGMRDLM